MKLMGKIPAEWSVSSYGGFRFKNHWIAPEVEEIKRDMLEEGHRSRLIVHLGWMKIYKDLKRNSW